MSSSAMNSGHPPSPTVSEPAGLPSDVDYDYLYIFLANYENVYAKVEANAAQ